MCIYNISSNRHIETFTSGRHGYLTDPIDESVTPVTSDKDFVAWSSSSLYHIRMRRKKGNAIIHFVVRLNLFRPKFFGTKKRLEGVIFGPLAVWCIKCWSASPCLGLKTNIWPFNKYVWFYLWLIAIYNNICTFINTYHWQDTGHCVCLRPHEIKPEDHWVWWRISFCSIHGTDDWKKI